MSRETYRYRIAALVQLTTVTYYLVLLFSPIPEGNERIIDTIGGGLIAMSFSVIQFYFGSSEGSQRKDDTLASIHQQREAHHSGREELE
jgi:hypothetical protein